MIYRIAPLFLALSLVLCIPHHAGAQRITGTLIDAESGETIPFAHITDSERTRGTISDANGQFDFKLPDDPPIDTVLITCLGYESRRIAVAELQQGDNELMLQPTSLNLGEVVVRADRKIKERWIGTRVVPPLQSGFGSASFTKNYSAKYAIPMEWDRSTPFRLLETRVHIGARNSDSLLVMRSYLAEWSKEQKIPGKPITDPALSEPFTDEKGWITVSFDEEDIWSEDTRFFLIVEFMGDLNSGGGAAPMLTTKPFGKRRFYFTINHNGKEVWASETMPLLVSLKGEYVK